LEFALDHIVYAVTDLARGCESFADLTGVRPIHGGAHSMMGTQNALASFDDRVYLELIAPDPETAKPDNLGGRLAKIPTAQLFAWALQAPMLDEPVQAMTQFGLSPTPPTRISRAQPSGETIHWEIAGLRDLGGAWPFFISWRDAPHPSTEAPLVGSLLLFEATLPITEIEMLPFAGCGGATLRSGPPTIALAFESPNGPVEWSQSEPIGFFGSA